MAGKFRAALLAVACLAWGSLGPVRAAEITGTLVDSRTAEPLAAFGVVAYRKNARGQFTGEEVVAWPDATGAFSLRDLAAGFYVLYFAAPFPEYKAAYYPDAQSAQEATVLELAESETLDVGTVGIGPYDFSLTVASFTGATVPAEGGTLEGIVQIENNTAEAKDLRVWTVISSGGDQDCFDHLCGPLPLNEFSVPEGIFSVTAAPGTTQRSFRIAVPPDAVAGEYSLYLLAGSDRWHTEAGLIDPIPFTKLP